MRCDSGFEDSAHLWDITRTSSASSVCSIGDNFNGANKYAVFSKDKSHCSGRCGRLHYQKQAAVSGGSLDDPSERPQLLVESVPCVGPLTQICTGPNADFAIGPNDDVHTS